MRDMNFVNLYPSIPQYTLTARQDNWVYAPIGGVWENNKKDFLTKNLSFVYPKLKIYLCSYDGHILDAAFSMIMEKNTLKDIIKATASLSAPNIISFLSKKAFGKVVSKTLLSSAGGVYEITQLYKLIQLFQNIQWVQNGMHGISLLILIGTLELIELK